MSIPIDVRRTSTYGDLIEILKVKHRYIDPRPEFDGIPLDPTSTVNPAVGAEKHKPIIVMGKLKLKGGYLPPADIYVWVKDAVHLPSSTDLIPKYSLPAHFTIGHLLVQAFMDPAFSRYQTRDRLVLFNGTVVDSGTSIGEVSTTEANPILCCFSGQPSGSERRPRGHTSLPTGGPQSPNWQADRIVHFAGFLFDSSGPRKFALPGGSTVAKLLTDLGGPAVLFLGDRVLDPGMDLTGNQSTEWDPIIACKLRPNESPEREPVWNATWCDESKLPVRPQADLVEMAFRFPGTPSFELRQFRGTETVADAIACLQSLQNAQGNEPPTIARLQFNGEDLALDRPLVTIRSHTMNPISVVFEGPALCADWEGRVERVTGAIGGNRGRYEVIAALERNGWDETGAIAEFGHQARPPPAPRTSRFLPPAPTDAAPPRFADPSQEEPGMKRYGWSAGVSDESRE
jgi:hypothetical protein